MVLTIPVFRGYNEAPAIATVITAQQIKEMGARDILDVLRTVPGFGVTRSFSNFSTIEVRGVKSELAGRVLIMLDGINLNNPYFGGATIFGFPVLENVKRIEVIRGPGSVLHGANALVSVINIITKKAVNIDGLEVKAGMGSYDSRRYNLLYGLEGDKFDVSGVVNYYSTDGPGLPVNEDSANYMGQMYLWLQV